MVQDVLQVTAGKLHLKRGILVNLQQLSRGIEVPYSGPDG